MCILSVAPDKKTQELILKASAANILCIPVHSSFLKAAGANSFKYPLILLFLEQRLCVKKSHFFREIDLTHAISPQQRVWSIYS